jgi:hypothetical protein
MAAILLIRCASPEFGSRYRRIMDAASPPPRVVRRSWVWGGSLLIAGTVLAFLPAVARGMVGMSVSGGAVSVVVTALAWLSFAFGADRIVAKPSGAVALVVLALWPVLDMVAWAILSPALAPPGALVPEWWSTVYLVDLLVPAVAALVVAVDVLRSDKVPKAFRRMPLMAVALCTIPAVGVQVAMATQGASTRLDVPLIIGLSTLASFCRLVALIGLGVIAIVAAQQPRTAPASIRVFPPPDQSTSP